MPFLRPGAKKLIATAIIFAWYALAAASRVTVDADGGASYTSFDAVLGAIAAGTVSPDTIEFIGDDVDTYTMSTYLGDKGQTTVVIKSNQTDPDLFPVINHTNTDYVNWFSYADVFFENLTFTGTKYFTAIGNKTITFSNCCIRDFSGKDGCLIQTKNSGTQVLNITNCLFEGNNGTPGVLYLNNFDPAFTVTTIVNCTFDGNSKVFELDNIDNSYNLTIKNCIFSNNASIFQGNNFRSKVTYSLTSESIANYGTGCVSNSDPLYVTATRNNPVDWKIQASSPAKDIGTSTDAPAKDLAGENRPALIDAGCFEYIPPKMTWDVSTSTGIQAGNGIWGTDNYWTADGTTLEAWPGPGFIAEFSGSNGEYDVTVSGTQYVNSLVFSRSGYTINSGTLSLGGVAGIYISSGKSATIASQISGSDGLDYWGIGTLTLSASNNYTGATNIKAGTLALTGSLASGSAVTVESGASLRGNGTVNGATTVQDGGIIAPGSGVETGKLSFASLTLNSTSSINITLGTTSDTIAVTDGLILDGTVNVVAGEGFGLGDYTIFTCGSLTNNTLEIGSFPNGCLGEVITSANSVIVRVKGVYTWDNSTEEGYQAASGTWGSDDYWSVDGTSLVPWPVAGNTARFAGEEGSYTVTVNGIRNADSIIFVNSLYTLSNGTINLGSNKGIYVSNSKNAIIESVIDGTAGVALSGGGTLILTGTNSYSGGTTINGGTIQIGNNTAQGSVTGNITNNGTVAFSRSDSYTFAGTVSGTGVLSKLQNSTLILTADNTYNGGTTVSAGTLQLGDNSTAGSVSGNITNNAAVTFSRSNAQTWAGVISGTGAVTKLQSNTLTFTANNTYSGATTVSAGTLQFGNNSTAGSVAGDIVNNATVTFSRSDNCTYSGSISGTGAVSKL